VSVRTALVVLVLALASAAAVACDEDTSPDTSPGPGGAGAGGVGGAGPDCQSYCAEVTSACAAPDQQYLDPATCEAVCASWDEGEPGAEDGDSLACRATHASAAATDAAAECPLAGPYGGGACGDDNCAAFCALVLEICTGEHMQYAGEADCMADCTALPDASDPFHFDPNASGDTFACRARSLMDATTGDPEIPCALAGKLAFPCQ
jgi:hypothetical protein